MRKLLLSSVALLGLTAGATAADLPRRQYVAPVPYVAVPVFTWTGFYVGVNAGGAFRVNDNNNTCVDTFGTGFGDCFGGSGLSVQTANGLAPVVPLTGLNTFGFGFNDNRNNDVAFAGGGQIGYNYQFTPGSGWVIGIEADIQGLAHDNNRNDNFGGFGGLGNNGIFTAAPVAPIAPGSGIANPTGVGNGALGNVALFNGGLGSLGGSGCGSGSSNGFGNSFGDCRPDWFATVRGKLGYAWDRFLIYGTGGVAFRDDNNRNDCGNGFGCGFGTGLTSGASLVGTGFYVNAASAFAGNLIAPGNTFGFFTDNRNNNNVGWTAGGGLSYAFTNNLVATVEGLYVSFERNRDNFNGALLGGGVVGVSNTGAPVTANQLGFGLDNRRNRDDFAVVRAKLDFKFGGPAGLFGL
jgi:outer membrane immunogenic protein